MKSWLGRLAWLGSWIIGGLLINGIFVNCSGPFQVTPQTLDLPSNHPDVEGLVAPKPAQSQVQLADREFIESFLRDVFTSREPTGAEHEALSQIFMAEFGPTQHHLGGSCSIYDEGSMRGCYYVTTNQFNPFYASSSSAREGSRYQVCRRLVAHPTLMAAVLSKFPERTSTPDDASLAVAVSLFYPDFQEPHEIIASLRELDQAAAFNREPVADRWRLIVLALCESPGWQILSD